MTIWFVNDSWFTVNEKLLTPLAQSIRMHLALTETTSASDAAIQKKLWIRNNCSDNLKIIDKGVSETIENEAKKWIC